MGIQTCLLPKQNHFTYPSRGVNRPIFRVDHRYNVIVYHLMLTTQNIHEATEKFIMNQRQEKEAVLQVSWDERHLETQLRNSKCARLLVSHLLSPFGLWESRCGICESRVLRLTFPGQRLLIKPSVNSFGPQNSPCYNLSSIIHNSNDAMRTRKNNMYLIFAVTARTFDVTLAIQTVLSTLFDTRLIRTSTRSSFNRWRKSFSFSANIKMSKKCLKSRYTAIISVGKSSCSPWVFLWARQTYYCHCCCVYCH